MYIYKTPQYKVLYCEYIGSNGETKKLSFSI